MAVYDPPVYGWLYQEVKRQLFGFGIIGSAKNFFRIIVQVSATWGIVITLTSGDFFRIHLIHLQPFHEL